MSRNSIIRARACSSTCNYHPSLLFFSAFSRFPSSPPDPFSYKREWGFSLSLTLHHFLSLSSPSPESIFACHCFSSSFYSQTIINQSCLPVFLSSSLSHLFLLSCSEYHTPLFFMLAFHQSIFKVSFLLHSSC